MSFGGWAIEEEVFSIIKLLVPKGGTILELGSGEGTKELCRLEGVGEVGERAAEREGEALDQLGHPRRLDRDDPRHERVPGGGSASRQERELLLEEVPAGEAGPGGARRGRSGACRARGRSS